MEHDTSALRAQLVEAIKSLPKIEQQVLALRYPEPGAEEACTFEEIGHLMHLPPSRIRVIFWRALERLRPILGDIQP